MRGKAERNWHLAYLGKPWNAKPEPPHSYNCGELVRSVYRDLFGIETSAIPVANAQSALQCARAMQPEIFDLLPVPIGNLPQEFDVCFMGRKTYMGHCGIAVMADNRLQILHCPESVCGVTVNSELELRYSGFPLIRWFRHKDFCQC